MTAPEHGPGSEAGQVPPPLWGNGVADARTMLRITAWGLFLPTLTICVVAYVVAGSGSGPGGALLLMLGALLPGMVVGFLFSIPKTRSRGTAGEALAVAPPGGAASPGPAARRVEFRPNTNIEEISDWLTKIIVGVGLVQFREIAAFVESTGAKSAGVLGAIPGAAAFATSILLGYFFLGFFVGYLNTRLVLSPALEVSENPIDRLPSDAKEAFLRLPETARAEAFANLEAAGASTATAAERLKSVEATMVAGLYDEQGNGYLRTIEVGEAYLGSASRLESASIHGWLCCAYGQKHRATRRSLGLTPEAALATPESSPLGVLRERTLQHARRAVELDPTYWKAVLRRSLDTPEGVGDDDLRDLAPWAPLLDLLA